jgi:hypothetical protein
MSKESFKADPGAWNLVGNDKMNKERRELAYKEDDAYERNYTSRGR